VTAREFAYDMPDQVPAGLVQVRLINQGTDLHEALVVRLTGPDASASAYVDSVRADVDFPAFATDLGGPGLTLPGASSLVWLALERGRYAIVCWKGNHLRQGMAHDLEVTAATGAPPAVPSSTATVHLVDYAFDPSGPLRAGQQVLHIRNTGSEPHEADLFRLAEGQSPAEYIRWLQEGEVGVPPVEPVGGLGDLAPGREIWVQVTLRPGRYFWLCQVPAADGRPHYERGMVLEFTVS
jgi:uncharacterized cupredoxin-like copper-binding protein